MRSKSLNIITALKNSYLQNRYPQPSNSSQKGRAYASDTFVVLNKPAGLACQGGQNVRYSLDTSLRKVLNKPVYLVHRLDRETSGALIVATTSASARYFTEAFQKKTINKHYLALLKGRFLHDVPSTHTSWMSKPTTGKIENMASQASPPFEKSKKACIATTVFHNVHRRDDISCVLMQPLTGRKHQLRLHTQELGAPILGDKRYGEGGPHLFLHALRLSFQAPDGKALTIEAPLPTYFEAKLKTMEFPAHLFFPESGHQNNQNC